MAQGEVIPVTNASIPAKIVNTSNMSINLIIGRQDLPDNPLQIIPQAIIEAVVAAARLIAKPIDIGSIH